MKNALVLALVFVTTSAGADTTSAPPPSTGPQRPDQYLTGPAMPDALQLLLPPPAEGSDALARDKRNEQQALAMQGTPRWDQAIVDADLFSPAATGSFSCAAGLVISKETTPKLDALMRKAAYDFGLSTYPAKNKYKRQRPFVGNGKPQCTPDQDARLRNDGSYPSGHAAIGFGWARILAEIVPKRAKPIAQRGARFADSRRICNVHFTSDIEAGNAMSKAVFNALMADPVFQADLAAAKDEVRKLRKKPPECAIEKAAFK